MKAEQHAPGGDDVVVANNLVSIDSSFWSLIHQYPDDTPEEKKAFTALEDWIERFDGEVMTPEVQFGLMRRVVIRVLTSLNLGLSKKIHSLLGRIIACAEPVMEEVIMVQGMLVSSCAPADNYFRRWEVGIMHRLIEGYAKEESEEAELWHLENGLCNERLRREQDRRLRGRASDELKKAKMVCGVSSLGEGVISNV